MFGAYTLTKDVTIGVGAAVLFGGGFVKQSTDYTRLWTLVHDVHLQVLTLRHFLAGGNRRPGTPAPS